MKWAGFTAAIPAAMGLAGFADGATVEGCVELPRPAATAALPPRYENVPAALIGRPPPPVAVVFLEGDFPAAPPATNAVLAQHHLQFAESVLPVQAGTAVEFPNHDRLFHNVFSYSKPRRFDLGRYTLGDRPPPQLFDQPGIVRLNCEIHPHMRATILVLATPYFTRTDTNGAFRLTGLPAGRWTLRAWVEEKDVREQAVELTGGATLKVSFPAP
ncbi:MAG: carboxypeptidase regulatory-like domain-containing protein [Limisphaerales bacterium]